MRSAWTRSARRTPRAFRPERAAADAVPTDRLHVMSERDVGLFSLVQQVIGNVPWALAEGRVPIVDFGSRTCYWTPRGLGGRDNVWEYYFEPLHPDRPAASIPTRVRAATAAEPPAADEVGYRVGAETFVTAHFGDHPYLGGATTPIPYELDDPGDGLRRDAKRIIDRWVRPRRSLLARVARFDTAYMAGSPVIGVHARGTDAVSELELRPHRRGSLVLERYVDELHRLLGIMPTAKVFVASDDERSLHFLRRAFPHRVIAHGSIRHHDGEGAGVGPTGWLMPAYIAGDRDVAARNGQDAVIEYLLLSRCDYLVHNGSGLARTVLLNAPRLPHTNTHTGFRS